MESRQQLPDPGPNPSSQHKANHGLPRMRDKRDGGSSSVDVVCEVLQATPSLKSRWNGSWRAEPKAASPLPPSKELHPRAKVRKVRTESNATLEPVHVIAETFLCTLHISGLPLHLRHKGTFL